VLIYLHVNFEEFNLILTFNESSLWHFEVRISDVWFVYKSLFESDLFWWMIWLTKPVQTNRSWIGLIQLSGSILKLHTSLLYIVLGEKQNVKKIIKSEFTAKSTRMTYFFWWDSEVWKWWTLYSPMRPRERICEWQ